MFLAAAGTPAPHRKDSAYPGAASHSDALPAPGRVEVFFDRYGSKVLHLNYARLTRLLD